MKVKVYNYHPDTKEYVGSNDAVESPLEPGKYLLPAHATFDAPPEIPVGKRCIWVASEWALEDAPVPEPVPEPIVPHVPTADEIKNERLKALSADMYASTGELFYAFVVATMNNDNATINELKADFASSKAAYKNAMKQVNAGEKYTPIQQKRRCPVCGKPIVAGACTNVSCGFREVA